MRIAFIADIHSNLHALEVVIERIGRLGVDAVACAGDIIGYGAFPNECCRVVAETADYCVFGNHDQAALRSDTVGMNPYAAKALKWTADKLNHESAKFLSSLAFGSRFRAEQISAAMFHGSPHGVEEYLFEGDLTEEMMQIARSDLVILGHTHVPYWVRFGKGMALNPGSVGQPRDGNPKASFAVFDSSTPSCEIIRVEYAVGEAADAILAQGLPEFLAGRLSAGR
jgi:putative phosphoesterase